LNKQLAARAEAAAWITRLHGANRTPEMEAGFRKWLRESAENRAEFEGLTDIWAAVGTLPLGGIPRLERWEHSAESLELQQLRRHLRDVPSRWRTRPRWWAPGMAAALLASACVMVLTASWLLKSRSEPTYSTDVGEQRLVQLADKSRIWLNSQTRLRISFDSQQRRVELIRGEALFEVAPDAPRPFVVEVSGHRVTALGTSFVIRYESDHTAVTMVEGRAAIDSAVPSSGAGSAVEHGQREEGPDARRSAVRKDAALASHRVLSAGERLTFEPAGDAIIDAPSVEAVLAWRRGEVVLNDTPLQEAVSEMNHYDKTTLVIEDPALATLPVSGLYHTGDNEGFARGLAKMYRLDLEQRQGRIYLKSH
jgi:transmembrane sensor